MAILIPVNNLQYAEVTESSSRGTNLDYMINNVYHQKPSDLGGFNALNFEFKLGSEESIDGLCVSSEVTNPDLTWALNYWDGAAYQAWASHAGLTKGYNYLGMGSSQTRDQFRLQVTSINSEWDFNITGVEQLEAVDINRDGKVWLSEGNLNQVFLTDSTLTSGGGSGEAVTAQFNYTDVHANVTGINGLSIGKGKNLWICGLRSDPQYVIWNVEYDGTIISSFQTSAYDASDTNPRGVTYDFSDGTLWLVSTATNKLYHITTTGTLISSVDLTSLNATIVPTGLCIDKTDGTLWVTDNDDDTVWNIKRDGTLIRSIPASRFNSGSTNIRDCAMDWDSKLLVADRTVSPDTLYGIWPNFGFYHVFAGVARDIGDPEVPLPDDWTNIDFDEGVHWKLLRLLFANLDSTQQGYINELKAELEPRYKKPFVFFVNSTAGSTDGGVFYPNVDGLRDLQDFNMQYANSNDKSFQLNARAWDIR